MSDFTYEYSTSTPLETFEWDNTWIDHANDKTAPRVLYIGDSISCGVRKRCNAHANGRVYFDGFGTSKALDNPVFFDSVRLFAAQEPGRDVILFNNGLHGWHLADDGEYATYFERMIEALRRAFPKTPLYLVLTTSVRDASTELRVGARNAVVLELAKKYALEVIDLYTVSAEYVELRSADGVHYTEAGYDKFADHILERIGL